MKYFLYLLTAISLFSCNQYQASKPKPFQKIPYYTSNDYKDSLVKKFIPDQDYDYWEYICIHNAYKNDEWGFDYDIVRFEGDSTQKKILKPQHQSLGFFPGCHPNWCVRQIAAVKNGKPKYVLTEDGAKTFIGSIDNIEEALYISLFNGYALDGDPNRNQYRINGNGYEMKLTKHSRYPLQKEAYTILIDKKGNLKATSEGVFAEGMEAYK